LGYVEDLRKIIGHRCVILCGCVVLIEDKNGLFLTQKRVYPENTWSFPGGLMELGESAIETARREVYEETGLVIDNLQLVGVYSGSDHLCRAQNGDEWYVVTIVYTTCDFTGEVKINDDESIAFEWVRLSSIPPNMAETHKMIAREYMKNHCEKLGI
jgi:8-oxo-dGTP pyrophosphatase MutT (NUDIX family)